MHPYGKYHLPFITEIFLNTPLYKPKRGSPDDK